MQFYSVMVRIGSNIVVSWDGWADSETDAMHKAIAQEQDDSQPGDKDDA